MTLWDLMEISWGYNGIRVAAFLTVGVSLPQDTALSQFPEGEGHHGLSLSVSRLFPLRVSFIGTLNTNQSSCGSKRNFIVCISHMI